MPELSFTFKMPDEETLAKYISVKGEKGDTGDGDMNKSVYDTNNNGIVDNAEKVNNLTVEKAVPANAVFTDTVYDDSNIQAQISSLASGSPLVASSISGMTDRTRVYVNTTDGHWYYYNGSTWTDGGVYESSADIDALKNSLDYTDELVLPLVNIQKLDYEDFEIGNIETSTTPYTWTYNLQRVRSKQTKSIHLEAGDVIKLKTSGTYRFYCIWTNSESAQNKSAWQQTSWTCTEDGDYQFVISKITQETVTNVAEYVQQLYVEKYAYDPINVADRVDDMITRKDFSQIFEMGNINTGTNPPVFGKSTSRVRTLSFMYLPLKKGDVLSFSEAGYVMYIGWYDENGSWHAQGWKDKITLTQNGKYVIVFRKNPEVTITDLSEAVSKFRLKHGYNFYDDIETEIQKNQRRNWFVKSINHRGYERLYPENTLIAFKQSSILGFDAVETDIRYTSDGVAVLLHDETINRTARNADGSEISETINIRDITYEQALQYDFGIYKGEKFAGTKIPTFEQAVALCRNLSLELYAELKVSNVAPLVNIVKKYGMAKHTTWISYNVPLLAGVKSIDGTARLGVLVGELTESGINNTIALKTDDNEVFIDVQSTYDPTSFIDTLITNNIGLEAYTPNLIEGISALNPYITGVTSDWLVAGKALYDYNIE